MGGGGVLAVVRGGDEGKVGGQGSLSLTHSPTHHPSLRYF